MDPVNELLGVLDKNGIRIGLNGDGTLRVRGDKGVLDDRLIGEIRKHKDQLIAVLRSGMPFALLNEDERARYGVDFEDAYPMSALQTGMVFHTQLEQFSGIYHDIMTDHVKCPWDWESFERALAACVEEHPVLRTGFRLDGARPLQHVHAQIELPLEVEDLRKQSVGEQERYLAEWREARKRHVFDWERGPLFQVNIFRRTDESFEFVLSFHHAVLDGWSRAAFTTQLYNRYEQLLRGEQPEPARTDWTYREFVAQEQRALENEAAKAHFAAMLEDAPARQLPRLDFSRERSDRRMIVQSMETLSAGLLGLAQKMGVPIQSVLLAGHFKVLACVSGQTRVVSCVPLNGRPETRGAERSIGMFLNSLPVCLEVTPGAWRKLVLQTDQAMAAAFEYRRYPLASIQRDTGWSFSEVLFDFTHFHVYQDASVRAGRDFEILRSSGLEQTNFDFNVNIARAVGGDSLRVELAWNAGALDSELIERMARYYSLVFENMLKDPDAQHHLQVLLSAGEVAQLLSWNDTAATQSSACVHERFEQWAAKTPQATAVVFGDRRLTYRELNRQANRLAHYLQSQGVRPGALVGICATRSPEMVTAVLAAWKAGAAYVPMDPDYPRERLEYMITDCAPAMVLAGPGSPEWPAAGVPFLKLDAEQALLKGCGEENLARVEITPEDIAYLLYTSGSTGRPKGVMVKHRGLSNYAAHAVARYMTEEIAGAVVSSPLSFDATVTSLLVPLAAGRIVDLLADDDLTLERLAERMFSGDEAWLFKITPAHLEALEYIERKNQVGRAAHRVVIGGEQLSSARLRKWKAELLPRACFVNEYGPTETVVGCSIWELNDEKGMEELAGLAAAPIGRPIRNTQLYVVGEGGQLQPVNSVGELYIGGEGVARGYWKREELTEERFVQEREMLWMQILRAKMKGKRNSKEDRRLYRTGDLVKWLESGELQFVGRRDDQVKVRGYRIEPGEIEEVLRGHSEVRQTAVMAREGEGGEKRLVAYVVSADQDRKADAETLKSYARERLPGYMVPSIFVLLDEMPLTPNGKVDRRALPTPEAAGAGGIYAAPRNETERTLCEVWQAVLKRDRVGVNDNFFSMGGDSILSIQMVSRVNRAGIAITMRQLLAHQTVGELAAHVKQAGVDVRREEAVEGEMPLLPIQHEFLNTAGLGSHHHNNQSVLLVVPSAFDSAALSAVTEALYRRHDALRLRFTAAGDLWRAVHAPLTDEMVAQSCAQEVLPEEKEAQAAFITERCGHYQRSLNIEHGPLLRAVYMRGPREGRLFLVIHHLVVDGVSWRIVLADVEQAFAQLRAGEPVVPAPKSSSFQQWARALEEYANSAGLQRERAYWLDISTRGASSWLLKSLSEGPASYAQTRRVAIQLSADETSFLLRECPATYRTGINELLLSAVYWSVREHTSRPYLRLTLEGHGREELFEGMDTTETVGCFTTTYPLLLHSPGGEMGEVIKAVKEQYRAVPNHGIGYGVLCFMAGQEKPAGEATASSALLFNYLGQFDQAVKEGSSFAIADEPSGDAVDPRRMRSHALALNGMVIGGSLRFQLDYSESQYGEAAMQELARSFERGLRAVIAHCRDVRIGEFTPGDFPLATADQTALDPWQRRYDIQSLYPATAMQKGMLFHGLLESEAYVSQLYPTLRGAVRLPLMREAWQRTIHRHSVFRTAFVGEGDEMHQLVVKHAELPWHEEDWRDLSSEEQEMRFERYRQADKARGFEVTEAPLMRLSMFRLNDDRYRLLWTHHHSLLDGWSIPLVYRDVMVTYAALARGKAPLLPPAPGYERYIQWLFRRDAEEARAYWRSCLDAADTVTPLPLDQKNEKAGVLHRMHVADLGAQQTQALKAWARKHRTTVNTLVQLAWGVLLHRYSGEPHVMFGAVVSGRPPEIAEVESMVGLFINTIPVVVSFDQEKPLELAVAQLHSAFQQSQEFGYLPLTEIQKQSRLGRGTQLFESLLVFENYPLESRMAAADASAAEMVVSEMGTSIDDTYPLALGVFQGESISVTCNYFGQRFTAAAVERLMEQLMHVLRQMPNCRQTGDIALLTPAEVGEVLSWNETAVSCSELPVHEQIAERARKCPEAPAVICGAKRMTCGELNEKADRLARYLRQAGVEPEARVGIYLSRSPELLIAVLGVMKSGGAYVALEPGQPRDRVKYMVEDAGIEWVLVESERMEELPLKGVDVVVMDGAGTDPAWMEEAGAEEPEKAKVNGESLAYILYTSGSTGRPKGVMVKHRGLSNYVGHAVARYMTGEIAGGVVSSPLSFDATVTTLLPPLAAGRVVELLEEDDRTLERLAAKMFEGEEPWLFKVTPAHLEALEYVERKQMMGRAAHRVVIGGEQLSAARLKRWKQELLPRARFVNEYGPTETVVGCCVWELKDENGIRELESLSAAPIGRPIGNTRLYVVGEGGQLQPVNGVGELYIGGAGVARGYWNQEELTRERFVEESQMGWKKQANEDEAVGSVDGGGRLYRTGDLVRRLENGELQFVGRRDDQVKLRGYRIELGEIEGVLRGHGAVAQAVAMVREGESGEKTIVAYVVGGKDNEGRTKEVDIAGLKSYAQQKLPAWMVPAIFVPLHELPLTVNGKVDRRALPAPEGTVVAGIYIEPRNEIERALCEVWQEVLKRERVGIQDNFFTLGGDSILSIRVVSQLKSRGIVLGIKDIFELHTIEQLAAKAMSGVHSVIDRMKDDAAGQKEKLLTEGKDVEEGVFL